MWSIKSEAVTTRKQYFPLEIFPLEMMRNHLRKNRLDFYDCVRPIYVMNRIFGLLPFTVDFDSDGNIERARVGTFDLIWFISFTAIYMAIQSLVDSSTKGASDFESSVLLIFDRLFWIVGCTKMFMAIILDMLNRHRFIKLLKNFLVFDKNVNERTS